ncbi:hypothetical protein L1887_49211 [Cichorium endivia]|nr:hypothetical protein L1887_49211 [Cichorium endivia]
MIGRADIEGSKSNVAKNARLPQASYPCDVPPQPTPPPDNVFRPDRPAEAGLGSKKRGIAPLPIHGISKITLKVVVFHFRPRAPTYTTPLKSFHKDGLESSSTGPPKEPFPVRPPAGTRRPRSRRGSSSSSRRQPTGSGLGPPCPALRANPFRGYGSILPTSLAYIVPSTRGCSPWRPDAVMSTTGRGRHSVLRIFKGRRGRTGHRATCGALPAAGPYLRLSHPHRRPLRQAHAQGFAATAAPSYSSGPGTCPDGRVSAQFWHRNPASGSSRIASSAYQKWPTWSSRFRGTAQRSRPRRPTYLKFENRSRALRPRCSNHSLYPIELAPGLQLSEGNFGGNQLLDGSISPFAPYTQVRRTICTSVSLRASTRVSSGFAPLRHSFTIFRVPTGMLTLEPFSEDQGRSAVHPARGIPPISFLAPCGFTHPLTRTHVRLLGPCFKTGRMGCPQAGAGSTQVYRRDGACCQPRSTRRHLHEPNDSSGFGRRTNPHRSTPRVDRRTGYRRSTSDRDASPAPIRFPPDNFKHSLTLFSKSFSSFPRGYLFAIGLTPVFSLGRIYRPIGAAFPKQPDSQTAPRGATGSGHDGALTLSGAPFQGTWARSAAEDASPDYNSDSEAVRFSSWADPGSLAVTKGILYMFTGRSALQGSTMILPQSVGLLEHSNFFKVTAPEARPGQLRPGAHRRQKGRVNRCTPEGGPATQPKVQLRAF